MSDLDREVIRARARDAADTRHRWASELGVTDPEVLAGLRKAKQLAVDDVPALLDALDRVSRELETMREVARGNKEHVAYLTRELERLQSPTGGQHATFEVEVQHHEPYRSACCVEFARTGSAHTEPCCYLGEDL